VAVIRHQDETVFMDDEHFSLSDDRTRPCPRDGVGKRLIVVVSTTKQRRAGQRRRRGLGASQRPPSRAAKSGATMRMRAAAHVSRGEMREKLFPSSAKIVLAIIFRVSTIM